MGLEAGVTPFLVGLSIRVRAVRLPEEAAGLREPVREGPMGLGKVARGGLAGMVVGWAGRLRFPYLFALTAIVFLVNLFVPDAVPFADEIAIGLFTVLLGSLRRKDEPGTHVETDKGPGGG